MLIYSQLTQPDNFYLFRGCPFSLYLFLLHACHSKVYCKFLACALFSLFLVLKYPCLQCRLCVFLTICFLSTSLFLLLPACGSNAGVYGDVQRVKILYNKKDSALIQMSDANQAQLGEHVISIQLSHSHLIIL